MYIIKVKLKSPVRTAAIYTIVDNDLYTLNCISASAQVTSILWTLSALMSQNKNGDISVGTFINVVCRSLCKDL